MKKKILVLGGTGFLGSFLVDALLNESYSVNVLQHKNHLHFKHQNLTVFTGNVCDKHSMNDAFHDVDIVINTVGQMTSPDTYYEINTKGVLNILQNCLEHEIEKIIFSSSVKVYGAVHATCTENTMPNPLSPEGVIKLVDEHLHRYYNENYHLPVICLRFANMYGPKQKKGVVFHFIHGILKNGAVTINCDGEQKRSFVYITDAVSATLCALNYQSSSFDIFNIADEIPISMNLLIDMIKNNLGTKVSINYDELRYREENFNSFDATKSKRELGYYPKINFEKGLSLTCTALRDEIIHS